MKMPSQIYIVLLMLSAAAGTAPAQDTNSAAIIGRTLTSTMLAALLQRGTAPCCCASGTRSRSYSKVEELLQQAKGLLWIGHSTEFFRTAPKSPAWHD